MNIEKGYEELAGVLQQALDQAQKGKGKERHAKEGEAFVDQQILEISRRQGNVSGLAFQVHKKLYEAEAMFERGEYGAAMHEMLGAIVYTAAMHIRSSEAQPSPRLIPNDDPLLNEPFAHIVPCSNVSRSRRVKEEDHGRN
ncbi:MAG: hypothetical protein WCS15_00130 [Prevotella sp.]|nr:hypothetical protein [Massilibacteroides sp.]